ncbi:MAG TPA: ECF transporter S component [Caldisericia bacterium]|nr:ECF transporter S component [Caldisericia bacterium]
MKITIKQLTVAGVLGALMVVMYFVGISMIPVPNISGAMTIMQIPVIIGAIVGGPVVGLLLGVIFAVIAQIMFGSAWPWFVLIPARLLVGPVAWWVYASVKKAFSRQGEIKPVAAILISVFVSLVALGVWFTTAQGFTGNETTANIIAAFIGVGLGFLTYFLLIRSRVEGSSVSLSAIAGTLTNTIGTLGLAVFLTNTLGETIPKRLVVAGTVAVTNGLLEVIIAVVVCAAVVPPLLKVVGKEA